MKTITVEAWVEGVTALLLHRATEEALLGETRKNTPTEREDPRVVAGRAIYRIGNQESGQIALPGAAFARLVREAGGAHKTKGSRKSLKYLVPAAVLVTDDLCGLYLRDRRTKIVDFEVDARPVTIPATKGRIMRYRARLNEWACRVTFRINEDVLGAATVRQLLTEGAQQIGVGDYRPEKGGPFGTSSLVAWAAVSEPRAKTSAQIRNGEARQE